MRDNDGFTNGKQRVATEKDVNAPWGGNKENFKCGFCGYKFKVGDKWRWQYTNDMPKYGGNPLVCGSCDCEPDKLRQKWREKNDNYRAVVRDPANWQIRQYA